MSNWPGLPPIDVGGWSDFQRKRLQQAAQERIASVGAVASDWGSEAQRRIEGLTSGIGDIASDLGAGVQAGLQSAQQGAGQLGQWGADLQQQITPDVVPDAAQPGGERVELGGLIGRMPLPPGMEGLRPGLEGYTEDVATAGRYVAQHPGEVASALDTASGFLPGRFTQETLPRVARGQGAQVIEEAGRALPALGAVSSLVPTPGFQAGNALANVVEEPLLEQGVHPALAGAAGFAADVLTPDAGTAARATRAAGDAPDWARAALDRVQGLADRFGAPPQEALGVRAGRPPTGPSSPGAPMTPEQIQQRVKDAEEAMYTWSAGQTAEVDYVARLARAGLEGETLPQGTTDWNALFEAGRVDPDALNRALVAYREEGLSEADALARAVGTPEERAANLQIGAEAGGVRDPSGLTKGLLQNAIKDLAQGGRPFATRSERQAAVVGRNTPPDPAGKKNAWEYVDKNGNSQWLSTPYEVLFAKQLDANPDVAYWTQSSPEALMETTVRHGGTPKVFTPDFIVVGTDGRIQVIEIKNIGAYRQVNWRVPEKLREAEEFFNSKGVGFSIFVEDQLGRDAARGARPEDFLPDANGRSGVVNGFFVESEGGSKSGRFDVEAAREELAKRLRSAGGSWELDELGYLSGRHPATQEQYDELVSSTHWPAWRGRLERGNDPDRGPARITPVQRAQIIKAGPGGVDPAEGGYGTEYTQAYPLRPEQGGYDPRWTPHRAYAEFNERQRAQGAPP